jgi:hypothetical protein
MPTVVRRRLDTNHPTSIPTQQPDEWTKFVTSCVEDLLKAFRDRQPESPVCIVREEQVPPSFGGPPVHIEDTLAKSPAGHDITPTNGSPKFSREDEGISYDMPELPRDLASAVYSADWSGSQ